MRSGKASESYAPSAKKRAVSRPPPPDLTDFGNIAILADIRSVFVQKTVARMPSDRLLHAIRLLDDPSFTGTYQHMTPALLAARLKSFGIRPKMIRFETGVPPRRGYLLDDFAEAFARYLR